MFVIEFQMYILSLMIFYCDSRTAEFGLFCWPMVRACKSTESFSLPKTKKKKKSFSDYEFSLVFHVCFLV